MAPLPHGVRRAFRLALGRPPVEREVDAEVEFHLQMRVQELVAQGLAPEQARAEALRRFGDVAQWRARVAGVDRARVGQERRADWLEAAAQDLRYALRTLRRAPAFTAAVVLTLALGIGANAAVFSALDAALLRTPPYREPERLVLASIAPSRPADGLPRAMPWSYPKFDVLRQELRAASSVAAFATRRATLVGAGDAAQVPLEAVSAAYFPLLGVVPQAGRAFAAGEDSVGAGQVVVLGHALWRQRFGGDPAVLGRTVRLNDQPLTVVGVAPPGFRGLTGTAELWIPLSAMPSLYGPRQLQRAHAHWLEVVARLAPGTSLDAARQDARRAMQVVNATHPMPSVVGGEYDATLTPYLEARVNPTGRTAVLVLAATSLLVLLVACANVAGLLLARAVGRGRETAIRAALGAGRGRLTRQLLVEGMLLTALGAAVGLAVAAGGIRLLGAVWTHTVGMEGSRTLAYVDTAALALDGRVVLFTLLATAATGLALGLLPARTATRVDLGRVLQGGGRTTGHGPGSLRRPTGRALLVAAQMALTVVLLAGAGLLLRSLQRLQGVDPGFQPAGLVSFQFEIPRADPMSERPLSFGEPLLARVRALPGVAGASLASCAPIGGTCDIAAVTRIAGRAEFGEGEAPAARAHVVADDHFRVLGAPLLQGRSFGPSDREGAPLVVIVSATAARELFPGQQAIGQRLRLSTDAFGDDELAEVVGVVGDVVYGALEDEAFPDVYVPYRQAAMSFGTLLVRASGDPAAVMAAVRREAEVVNARVPLFDARPVSERLADATARTRLVGVLLVVFAAVALLLAVTGLYGVIAHGVAQRTRELGLRMALGAGRGRLLLMVLRQGAAIGVAGLVLGVVAARVVARYLEALLFEVTAGDVATFATVVLVLGAATLLAAWVPARRATRIEPVEALRE